MLSARRAWLIPLLAATVGCAVSGDTLTPTPAPPFPSSGTSRWLGTPVTWADLRGRVVLLDVWTFG